MVTQTRYGHEDTLWSRRVAVQSRAADAGGHVTLSLSPSLPPSLPPCLSRSLALSLTLRGACYFRCRARLTRHVTLIWSNAARDCNVRVRDHNNVRGRDHNVCVCDHNVRVWGHGTKKKRGGKEGGPRHVITVAGRV
eukprot:667262-Rhodomonas_salina.1